MKGGTGRKVFFTSLQCVGPTGGVGANLVSVRGTEAMLRGPKLSITTLRMHRCTITSNLFFKSSKCNSSGRIHTVDVGNCTLVGFTLPFAGSLGILAA